MWRRLFGLAASLTGIIAPVQAQTSAPVSAQAAPVAWIQYAKLVEQQFEGRLGDDSISAQRLRTYLQSGKQQLAATIPIAVWIDPQGKISRLTFTPFLDSQANSDMTGLLQGVQLPQSPPRDILLPIRLKLQVAAAPAPQSPGPAPGSVPPPQH